VINLVPLHGFSSTPEHQAPTYASACTWILSMLFSYIKMAVST